MGRTGGTNMKKLMTLVLAVCMLLAATTAFADAYQDEKAPALVSVTVYDAEGNATAITDMAQVTLIDISARAEGDAVMAAAARSGDFAAQNLIVVEKFFMAVEGAKVIEATFALQDWQEVSLALVTVDGAEWANAELTVNEDGTVTVKTVPGVVAFTSLPGASEEAPTLDEIIENSKFTPSVAAKPAPSVTRVVLSDGEGNIISADMELGTSVVVTPVANRAYIKDINVYDNLKTSFEGILNAKSFADLGLAGVENMVVRDLFNVTVYGVSLQDGAFVLMVTFETEAPAAIAVNGSNGWKLLPAENIIDNGNGTVTVALTDIGTLAFFADALAQNAVTSPAT